MRSPQRPEAYQGPSKVELSVTLVNVFQPSKRTPFLCGGGSRYPSADTVILEKALKNTGNVLAKIVKKSIFSEMKLPGSVMKKRTSFPLSFALCFKN